MTFGYELEFLGASLIELSKKYQIPYYEKLRRVRPDHFHLKPEPGFTENLVGGELISPVYQEKEVCLQELREKLVALKSCKAFIPENSEDVGFHIHVGKDFLKQNPKRYEMLLKFLYAFQPEIYDFARGNHDKIRLCFYEYAAPLEEIEVCSFLSDIKNTAFFHGKGKCLRFTLGTVEFRYFNSSLEEQTLKQYFDFVLSLCHYIESDCYDEEMIQYYFLRQYDLGLNPKQERKDILTKTLKIEY